MLEMFRWARGSASAKMVELFRELVVACPRLVCLDVDLMVARRLDESPTSEEQKVEWPADRQKLKIIYYDTPDGRGRLKPWLWFKGNVEVIRDPQVIKQLKREAESKWIISPYRRLY